MCALAACSRDSKRLASVERKRKEGKDEGKAGLAGFWKEKDEEEEEEGEWSWSHIGLVIAQYARKRREGERKKVSSRRRLHRCDHEKKAQRSPHNLL